MARLFCAAWSKLPDWESARCSCWSAATCCTNVHPAETTESSSDVDPYVQARVARVRPSEGLGEAIGAHAARRDGTFNGR